MKTMTSVEVKNRFDELLGSTQREPITITQRGRPIAFVISPEDMKELLDARRQREQALTDFEAFLQRSDSKLRTAAKKLSDNEIQQLVDKLR